MSLQSSVISSPVQLEQLAVFSAQPAFKEKLFVGRPNIGDRPAFLALVNEILDRCWLTNDGPVVQELEKRLADYVGVRHCVAMCNATVALEIAIRALGLTGEVIIPSYTFVATAHALQWQQITPVFADIREDTHCLDPAKVERMITPRTTGIIGVHVWGQPCDVDALSEIARRRNLHLMFDAAHAFGCTHKGRMVGNNGECEVFSFHATKFFNTLEGGAVTTNDDELAKKMRLMRNFGFAGLDNVVYIGTNGKMNEISAAMGLVNLDNLNIIVETNRRNHVEYRRGLTDVVGLRLLEFPLLEKINNQYVVIEVNATCPITRDELVNVLHAENVIARKYFWPGCHRMEPYKSLYPHAGLLLPTTERVAGRVLLVPTGTAVSAEMIGTICNLIKMAVSNAAEIRKVL